MQSASWVGSESNLWCNTIVLFLIRNQLLESHRSTNTLRFDRSSLISQKIIKNWEKNNNTHIIMLICGVVISSCLKSESWFSHSLIFFIQFYLDYNYQVIGLDFRVYYMILLLIIIILIIIVVAKKYFLKKDILSILSILIKILFWHRIR